MNTITPLKEALELALKLSPKERIRWLFNPANFFKR